MNPRVLGAYGNYARERLRVAVIPQRLRRAVLKQGFSPAAPLAFGITYFVVGVCLRVRDV